MILPCRRFTSDELRLVFGFWFTLLDESNGFRQWPPQNADIRQRASIHRIDSSHRFIAFSAHESNGINSIDSIVALNWCYQFRDFWRFQKVFQSFKLFCLFFFLFLRSPPDARLAVACIQCTALPNEIGDCTDFSEATLVEWLYWTKLSFCLEDVVNQLLKVPKKFQHKGTHSSLSLSLLSVSAVLFRSLASTCTYRLHTVNFTDTHLPFLFINQSIKLYF